MSHRRVAVQAQAWLENNTMRVRLGSAQNPFTDPDTGDPITDAVVTAILKDGNDNEVGGESWPLTLDHQGNGSNGLDGVYWAEASYLVAVVAPTEYWAEITADVGVDPDIVRYFARVKVLGAERTGATATT